MRKTIITLIIVNFLTSVPFAVGQDRYTPRELSFLVYPDGYVVVDYHADLDPTRARVNISLFGSLYLDIFVEDQDELPLDYASIDGGLIVDTLGSAAVLISYVTADLTGKVGQIWTFTASTPINATILLPEGVTVVDMSAVPLAMGSFDGALLITLPAGDIEVAYIIGVVGTREHALAVIKDAEVVIGEIRAKGVVVDEAENLLTQSWDAFEVELYAEAEQLASQAKSSAQAYEEVASLAAEAIEDASSSIFSAEETSRTVGLDEARVLLRQAEDAYDAGDYTNAKALAMQAKTKADIAETPEAKGLPLSWIALGAGLIGVAIFIAFYLRRAPEAVETRARFDLDALFEAHTHLRFDDREVIRFLAEAGGGAFAAEIRERFDVPRTSLWRMIRRLEGEGIVGVETIGGQSLVRISDRYREGGE